LSAVKPWVERGRRSVLYGLARSEAELVEVASHWKMPPLAERPQLDIPVCNRWVELRSARDATA
jgi:hypothetical protein